MKIIYMGTPDFAVVGAEALRQAGLSPMAVYTQPPRPAGRGHKPSPSPLHAWAMQHGIPVYTPVSLKNADAQAQFASLNADVAVVAAYGLLLPQAILDTPRYGCVNIHASLLPRWRGAAPIHRALLAGDEKTGITIMQMDKGLDTGGILMQEEIAIPDDATTPWLHDALAKMGGRMIVQAMRILPSLNPAPQPDMGATYAAKLTKDEGRLDWALPAPMLDRKVRALNPQPSTWFMYMGERIKVLAAQPVAVQGQAGQVLDDTLLIGCGEGALRLLLLQRAGKKPMTAAQFLQGFAMPKGSYVAG